MAMDDWVGQVQLFMSSTKSVNLQKLCEVGTRTLLR